MKRSHQRRSNKTIGRKYGAILSYHLVLPVTAADGCVAFNRFANRADAAMVTARQFRSDDKGGSSIKSDSSSQSLAESQACSGPYNCVTAAMKEDSSRSASCVCSS